MRLARLAFGLAFFALGGCVNPVVTAALPAAGRGVSIEYTPAWSDEFQVTLSLERGAACHELLFEADHPANYDLGFRVDWEVIRKGERVESGRLENPAGMLGYGEDVRVRFAYFRGVRGSTYTVNVTATALPEYLPAAHPQVIVEERWHPLP
jgi:hypothetical protein